jgi:transcriptional regulator with XRE-family HTH domain
MAELKDNIKNIRESKGMSQYQISKEMGMSQSAYARFEREVSKIDLKRLESFGKIVGMSVIDILTFPEKWVNIREIGLHPMFNQTKSPKVIIQVEMDTSDIEGLNLKEKLLTILNE